MIVLCGNQLFVDEEAFQHYTVGIENLEVELVW